MANGLWLMVDSVIVIVFSPAKMVAMPEESLRAKELKVAEPEAVMAATGLSKAERTTKAELVARLTSRLLSAEEAIRGAKAEVVASVEVKLPKRSPLVVI